MMKGYKGLSLQKINPQNRKFMNLLYFGIIFRKFHDYQLLFSLIFVINILKWVPYTKAIYWFKHLFYVFVMIFIPNDK